MIGLSALRRARPVLRRPLVDLAIALIVAASAALPRPTPAATPRLAHKAAIASAYPLASQAGQEILAAGGNAFDAAVAVAAALAVVEPTVQAWAAAGSILLHRQSDGFETMVDAREKAPGAASRDMYLDKAGNEIDNALDRRVPGIGHSRRARGVRISWRANTASCR